VQKGDCGDNAESNVLLTILRIKAASRQPLFINSSKSSGQTEAKRLSAGLDIWEGSRRTQEQVVSGETTLGAEKSPDT